MLLTLISLQRLRLRRLWRASRQAAQAAPAQLDGLYALLNRSLFSWLITYAKHPLHICALLLLWAVMLVGGSQPALELVLGNYTNGISALAACILLMRQLEHHAHQRARLDELHTKVDALSAAPARRSTPRKKAAE